MSPNRHLFWRLAKPLTGREKGLLAAAVLLFGLVATYFVFAWGTRPAPDGCEWVTSERDDSTSSLRNCASWNVSASMRLKAIALLATNKFIPISIDDAKAMSSEVSAESGGESAYLVQSLAEPPLYPLFQKAEFTQCIVYEKDRRVLYSSFVSVHDTPSAKWPAIVVLPRSNKVERMVGVFWDSSYGLR